VEQNELLSLGDWYAPLRGLESLGANDTGVAHQGELAAARRRHLGQFFTPEAVARFMWGFVDRFDPKRKVSLFDNRPRAPLDLWRRYSWASNFGLPVGVRGCRFHGYAEARWHGGSAPREL
jgi:hypothetical protein